jgi:hypothetical protein
MIVIYNVARKYFFSWFGPHARKVSYNWVCGCSLIMGISTVCPKRLQIALMQSTTHFRNMWFSWPPTDVLNLQSKLLPGVTGVWLSCVLPVASAELYITFPNVRISTAFNKCCNNRMYTDCNSIRFLFTILVALRSKTVLTMESRVQIPQTTSTWGPSGVTQI